MEIRQILQALKRRKLLTAGLVVLALVAAVGAKTSTKSTDTGAASLQLLVDSQSPVIANFRQDTAPLIARAPVLAQVMASSVIQQRIARAAGIPANQLSATGPFSGPGPGASAASGASSSGSSGSSGGASAPAQAYQLNFTAQDQLPLISVSATAPTAAAAAKLANAVAPTVTSYLSQLENPTSTTDKPIPAQDRVIVRQLGSAQSNPVSSSSGTMLAAAAFIGILVIGSLVILSIDRRRTRREGGVPAEAEQRSEAIPDPVVLEAVPSQWDRPHDRPHDRPAAVAQWSQPQPEAEESAASELSLAALLERSRRLGGHEVAQGGGKSTGR